jgi:hypothetical protein
MFTPSLTLVPQGKKFTLAALVEVPGESFSAGSIDMGAPKSNPVGANVLAYQLNLVHSAKPAAQVITGLQYRVPSLNLKPGQSVTAFVMLDGKILGSASIVLSGKHVVALAPKRATPAVATMFRADSAPATASRPPLTSDLCQAITVRNTPRPGDFTGFMQTLDKLGIIDDTQANAHKAAIQQDLNQIGWHVQQSDIQSAPAKTVRDCSDSVQNNAF